MPREITKKVYEVSTYDIYVIVCRVLDVPPIEKQKLWKEHWDRIKRRSGENCIQCGKKGPHDDDCFFDLANVEKDYVR